MIFAKVWKLELNEFSWYRRGLKGSSAVNGKSIVSMATKKDHVLLYFHSL